MPWLLRDDTVLAALEVAESFRARSKGLLGRDGIDGALLLRPARQVHSFGMRFPIDVAFCGRPGQGDGEAGPGTLVVRRMVVMPPGRITRPSVRCRCILEAEAGAFARWGLAVGDRLEISP
ncbi:MAG: DUF192 domain-containing protein [Acidimicrobiales bacterium]